MKTKLFTLAVIVVAVVALGLTGFSYASAQTQDAPLFQQRGPGGPEGEHPLRPYVEAAVADILGMSVEDLQAAKEAGTRLPELLEAAGLTPEEFRAALDEATPGIVAQALEDGAITQEQADFILENGLRRPRGSRGPRLATALRPYVEAAVADILGMSVEELQAAKEAGTRLPELLEAAGLTPEEFKAALEEATPGIVAQALEDGAITQEQADFILENGLRRPKHPGRHGPKGPGGRGPGGGGPQNPAPNAPTDNG